MFRRALGRTAVLMLGTSLAVCALSSAPASASQASGQATAAAHRSDQVTLHNPHASGDLGRKFT